MLSVRNRSTATAMSSFPGAVTANADVAMETGEIGKLEEPLHFDQRQVTGSAAVLRRSCYLDVAGWGSSWKCVTLSCCHSW